MFLILILTPLFLLYFLLNKHYQYWKNKNVPGPEPSFFVGNVGKSLIKQASVGQIITDIYREYDKYPFVGVFRLSTPCLLLRDPDLVKSVIVKDFKHFANNEFFVDKKTDPLFGRNAFVLQGEEWKNTRNILTPCFTSGRMKVIYPLVDEVAQRMIQYIAKQPEILKEGLELKELSTKFTLDNVASCAFGLEGKCFIEEQSEFRQLSKDFFSPGTIESFKLMISGLIPTLQKFLSIKFVKKSAEDKLLQIVGETIEYREKNNIVRPDFLHAMNQLRFGSQEFTLEDVTAQAAGFFADGYETSSIVMSFVLFNLATNQHVQDKLRTEIQKKTEGIDGNITYEAIQDLDYLEACIYESLRKNAIVLHHTKMCTEAYTFKTTNTDEFIDMSITVEPGTTVIIPILGFYSDEKYFPEPNKYIPERFMVNDKKNMDAWKNVYKPFGDGPRICLGQRFGLLQIKVGVANIIKNYKLTLSNKTKLPLTLDPWYIMASPIGGLWVNFEKIK